MSASSSTDRPPEPGGARRRMLLALLATAGLAACGKRGRLELPEPARDDDEAAG